MSLDHKRQEFFFPSDEFSPMPFWFWNDALTDEEIIRQIHDFKAKGVMGFIIHPRIGIPTDIEYLSDRFMAHVSCAVETAAKLGMKVILYDEGMYPSGSAHGKVVAHNPTYASRGLQLIEYEVETELTVRPELLEGDQIVSIQAAKKHSDQIDPTSFQKLELEDGQIHFRAPDSDPWLVLLFVVTYSKGTIRGIHFGEDDGEPGAPAATDLLNPEAIKTFINFTHDRYYEVLKDHFGTTIIGMFTDEPAILGRRGRRGMRPWTDKFFDWYLQHGGDEFDLAAFWYDLGAETTRIKRTYKQAINKLLEKSYYAQISDWCAEHNIALTGHPERSDDIGLLKYFHIPGQDVVWRWVAPENDLALTGDHSTQAKCSSDAARHRGLRRNSNECFACSGENGIDWAFNVWDMKWYMDWLFVRGVNLLYPHAFFYSVDGKGRYDERPPDVGPNNIWWPHYRQISDYMKRMSWLMTDSINQAQVAVLCEEDHLPWEVVRPLYEQQIEFNYLENELCDAGKVLVRDGKLVIEAQRYSVLIIADPEHITEGVTKLLPQFIAQGGRVIVQNPSRKPFNLEGVTVITDTAIVVPTISEWIELDLVLENPVKDLRYSHIVKDDIHFYLLVNEGVDQISQQIILNTKGKVEFWNGWEGKEIEIPHFADDTGTKIDLSLNGRESLVIVIDPNQAPSSRQAGDLPQFYDANSLDLSTGWVIENPPVAMDVSTQLKSWPDFAGLERFSGTLTYIRQFEVDPSVFNSVAKVVLDLGEVCELVTVNINQQDAGVILMQPYLLDITDYVREGNNEITLDISNTLANKYGNVKLKSGLLGPVTLRFYQDLKK